MPQMLAQTRTVKTNTLMTMQEMNPTTILWDVLVTSTSTTANLQLVVFSRSVRTRETSHFNAFNNQNYFAVLAVYCNDKKH